MMHRHYDARRRLELTGELTPIPSPALVDLVGRVPGAPPEQPQVAPSPRRPVAGRELLATRGAREGATGGGHRASGVMPREVPLSGSNFVRTTTGGRVGAAVAELKDAAAARPSRGPLGSTRSHGWVAWTAACARARGHLGGIPIREPHGGTSRVALASSSRIETTTTAQPRVEQIPHRVAKHV